MNAKLFGTMFSILCLCIFSGNSFSAEYKGKKGVWTNLGASCIKGDANGNLLAESYQPPQTSETAEDSANAACEFLANDPLCNESGNLLPTHSGGTYIDRMNLFGAMVENVYRFSCDDSDGHHLTGFSLFLNAERKDCKKTVGDPVDVSNGQSMQTATDISDIGFGGLQFTRYYLDYSNNAINDNFLANLNGHWSHEYAKSLLITDYVVSVFRPLGVRYLFSKLGNDWQPYDGTLANGYRLNGSVQTGFQLWTPEGFVEYYSGEGRLLRIVDNQGRETILTYNAANVLATVSTTFGKQLTLTYDETLGTPFQLASVTDQSGRAWGYRYQMTGPQNDLVSVVYPDDTPTDDTDNPRLQYLYDDPNFPGFLTGVIDENGNRYASWTYDAEGRVYINELAGGANRVELSFGPGDTTSVTDALNATRVYSFQNVRGVMKNTGVSQPGGSGCGAASNSISYDANGNIKSNTDFNGHTTSYSYDLTRNLEIQRVEAVGEPEARTISTVWHPYWRQPAAIA